MISVVIPLYNKEDYIKQTIESVLNQTFSDFEIIIVDDGSKDNSLKIVQGIKDSRLYVYQKKNGGVSSARNYGIRNAKFDYIAFLDADDLWDENYLKNMVQLINDFPKAEVYASNFFRVYPNCKKIPATSFIERGFIKNYFKIACKVTIIHTSSVIIHKEGFKKAGIFDERISRGEDMDLWTRLGVQCKIVYYDKAQNTYHLGTVNSSANFIPHPENIFAYYIKLENCINYYHFKYLKVLLLKRIFRYLILDFKFEYFLLIVKKQYKQIFKIYNYRIF